MKKSNDVMLISKELTVKIDNKSWSEMLLFLNNNGWKPSGLLTSFLGEREVSNFEAEQIKVVGQELLDLAARDPFSVYPVPFNMGKFAEFICICEEGSFQISKK